LRQIKTSCTLALLLAFLTAFASAAERQKTVNFGQKAVVGSQELQPGRYVVKYDDSAPTSQVKFILDGKTVATASAQLQHDPISSGAAYKLDTADGQNRIDRIYVQNNQELLFSTGDNQAATGK
jgi:hypothetical protein